MTTTAAAPVLPDVLTDAQASDINACWTAFVEDDLKNPLFWILACCAVMFAVAISRVATDSVASFLSVAFFVMGGCIYATKNGWCRSLDVLDETTMGHMRWLADRHPAIANWKTAAARDGKRLRWRDYNAALTYFGAHLASEENGDSRPQPGQTRFEVTQSYLDRCALDAWNAAANKGRRRAAQPSRNEGNETKDSDDYPLSYILKGFLIGLSTALALVGSILAVGYAYLKFIGSPSQDHFIRFAPGGIAEMLYAGVGSVVIIALCAALVILIVGGIFFFGHWIIETWKRFTRGEDHA